MHGLQLAEKREKIKRKNKRKKSYLTFTNQVTLYLWNNENCYQIVVMEGFNLSKTQSWQAFPGSCGHSHSMVPGGLEVTSRTTRLTPRTSLTMRAETRRRRASGRAAQSAVMPSEEVTARRAMTWS